MSAKSEKKKSKAKAKAKEAGAKKKAGKKKLSREDYEKKLTELQTELCHLQQWVVDKGLRVVVVFEGRDAAGKGGVIRRITERVSPRVFRTVALPAPTEREKTQMYAQRYLPHFPAAGEVIIFDRSWYNRAGVERVMGFCTDRQYKRFLDMCPMFERQIVEDGVILIKYFFDVSQEVQERRFLARIEDPMRQWKLSPMDVESWRRWWDYTAVYARMIEATDTPEAPWYCVHSDSKRRARLNCISHLLSKIPYERIPFERPKAGKRHEPKKGAPREVHFRNEIPQLY